MILDILLFNVIAAYLVSTKAGRIAYLAQMSTFNVPHVPIFWLAQLVLSDTSQPLIAILAL